MENDAKQILETAIQRVQRGNREAFRTVVDMCLRSVRAFVACRSLPGIDVDDVVQRVFVEAYQNIGDYKLDTKFQSWLHSIARYQLMMDSTRLRRLADYHSRYVPEAIASASEVRLAARADEDARLEYLQSCLQEVSQAGRDVLRRRYEKDESTQQIAAALNRSDGAIRKQLCVLRKQLHDCVAGKLATGGSYGR